MLFLQRCWFFFPLTDGLWSLLLLLSAGNKVAFVHLIPRPGEGRARLLYVCLSSELEEAGRVLISRWARADAGRSPRSCCRRRRRGPLVTRASVRDPKCALGLYQKTVFVHKHLERILITSASAQTQSTPGTTPAGRGRTHAADAVGALTASAAFNPAMLCSALKWHVPPNKDPEYWVPCPNKASG